MVSSMTYFNKCMQLDGFIKLANAIDFYFCNVFSGINIHDKNSIIDRIIHVYNEQGIIGDVPNYSSVLNLWLHKKYLTSIGKRKLNSLGKIYEYKVNLWGIQIRDTHVCRIRFNTDKAIMQFSKTFISLEKTLKIQTIKNSLLVDSHTYVIFVINMIVHQLKSLCFCVTT